MSDMKIAVRLRRKPGVYGIINTLCQILVNDLLDKVFGNCGFSSSASDVTTFSVNSFSLILSPFCF